MTKTLRAFYDGQVLRLEGPVDLEPNREYVVSVHLGEGDNDREPDYPLSEIFKLATDMGVTDLSTQHSQYAHGRLGEDDGDRS